LIRTITPARPAQVNDHYELKPWDLAEQSRSIELLKANTILIPSDSAFQALAYAEGEAILCFPDALDATAWEWDRAYNLVRINDPEGMSLYSDLIKSAITTGQYIRDQTKIANISAASSAWRTWAGIGRDNRRWKCISMAG
jgi:hypothetical protein